MNLRQKILLLATVPLILAVSAITLLVSYQAQTLSKEEVTFFRKNMLDAKKSELLNYLRLAQTSIRHIYETADTNDAFAQSQVRNILDDLTYGTDGYFFVYDYNGLNIVHPKQPHRVGNNWWHLTDSKGNKVIQNLILKAKQGGGYYNYYWEKPSTGDVAEKISYAIPLDKWKWMLGTGLYIDNVNQQVKAIEDEVSQRISQTTVIILIITLVSLVLVFITGVLINLHERRLADEKLKQLTQRIVETQEEERGRVARELHDSISQILVSVKFAQELSLTKLLNKDPTVQSSLEKSNDALHTAIKEVRRISRDLRPRSLDDLGLSPALKSLAEEFAERNGMKLTINTVAFNNLLPKEVKTTLYRVAQEALTNIERHAQAKHVKIKLSAPKGEVTLSITDDGSGFANDFATTKSNPLTGIGLRNMQERIEHHNGELKILSSNRGTTIRAKMPKKLLQTNAKTSLSA
jgi:two-component system NarL family sensor kinase